MLTNRNRAEQKSSGLQRGVKLILWDWMVAFILIILRFWHHFSGLDKWD